ncbi:hypothetical protein LR69_04616 [Geobacillus sp. BCO2]|nr:hypothetical protein LR69_04616 [Geobacillus sp. BCO2]
MRKMFADCSRFCTFFWNVLHALSNEDFYSHIIDEKEQNNAFVITVQNSCKIFFGSYHFLGIPKN